MRRRFKKAGGDDAGVNMTPMLDIVFILLIFFIVTATFVRERGIDLVPPPPSDETPPNPPPLILVQILENGNIFVNQQATDIARVGARIERFRSENPDSPVLIEPDPDAEHGIVVTVWDQANQVGARGVNIQVREQGEQGG
ncbi:MAG: biopolymer transporter ExbD [Euryhalocaulis sp.]|uniref:ExbD/TolR family protein n=1 Tax=Euryhalocaulis sp. TaxID=2744307 RepID=UPI0017A1C6B1|nr:biopolymer transporter ExbD [Euryhalocaulis sp.]MBA4802450.1 biopolymer transporter ExbD [Euryhalocaulis sp.]